MSEANTLLQLSGASMAPAQLEHASLVAIDMQNEYLEGPLAVTGADDAIAAAGQLLSAARAAGTPVIHVAHSGREGGLFDRSAWRGNIIEGLSEQHGEALVEKGLPNAFTGTDLLSRLKATERDEIILMGFMTHMCVSSTARAALDHGFRVSVDANACATRDLPDGEGGVVAAAQVHKIALIELSDRFAVIARDHSWT